jgi:hypothetical protein
VFSSSPLESNHPRRTDELAHAEPRHTHTPFATDN